MSPKLAKACGMLATGRDYCGREHDEAMVRNAYLPRLECLREISAKAPHLLFNPVVCELGDDLLAMAAALGAPQGANVTAP